jgi:crotonobetainyl-CoA:carnitine CoA-transferase CaiB-like acyl-CoA transferase
MAAHSAILQALFHRERTGEGSSIQVSLFDAVADWMNVPVLQQVYGNHETLRAGVNHPSLAPYGAYRCRDGKNVIFSVQNDREWVTFCSQFLRQPELTRSVGFADNMARLANRARLDEIINRRFAELTGEDAMGELEAAGIAYGRLNEIHTVADHPHVRKLEVDTPAGPIKVIAPPALINGRAPELGAVASLGEHTQSIRAEFARQPVRIK